MPEGCRFHERCEMVTDKIRKLCENHEPDLKDISPKHKVRCWLYSGS
jgi:oligopeptide/dipeptide ABC transporter ATP-binding protein